MVASMTLQLVFITLLALSSNVQSVPTTTPVKNAFRVMINYLAPSEKTKACPMRRQFKVGRENCEYMLLGWHGTSARHMDALEKQVSVAVGDEGILGQGFYITDLKANIWSLYPRTGAPKDPAICAVYAPLSDFQNSWQKIAMPRQFSVNRNQYQLDWASIGTGLLEDYFDLLDKSNVVPSTMLNLGGFSESILLQKMSTDDRMSFRMRVPASLASNLRVICNPEALSDNMQDIQPWQTLLAAGTRNGGFRALNYPPVESFVVQGEGSNQRVIARRGPAHGADQRQQVQGQNDLIRSAVDPGNQFEQEVDEEEQF